MGFIPEAGSLPGRSPGGYPPPPRAVLTSSLHFPSAGEGGGTADGSSAPTDGFRFVNRRFGTLMRDLNCLDSPMLIVCPNCATSYRVEPTSLGAAGRSVRCVRCRSVWFANDPAPLSTVADGFRGEVLAIADQSQAVAHPAGPTEEQQPAESAVVYATDTLDELTEQSPPEGEPAETAAPPLAPEPTAYDPLAPPEYLLPQGHAPIAMRDAPPLAIAHEDPGPLAGALIGEDVETVAARRAKERARRRFPLPMPGLPATIMALIAINTVLIGWRADVVKVLPQTASLFAAVGLPVNLRGLAFTEVKTSTESHEGVSVLVVEGTIASASKYVIEVPRLRFAVRNPKGQEVYAWTALPARSMLAPGETLAFRSRLASPPSEGNDVAVRFFNRHDRVVGIQ
jgi:predicted Zn finger-like uncharacterized protein